MITGTKFGSITINNKTYTDDVYVCVDGSIEKRDKVHVVGKVDFDHLSIDDPEVIVIGIGQSGVCSVDEKFKELAKEKNIEVISDLTPQAIKIFNKLKKRKAGLFHTTC